MAESLTAPVISTPWAAGGVPSRFDTWGRAAILGRLEIEMYRLVILIALIAIFVVAAATIPA
ncbi:MAG: hypothetical protein WEB00_13575 [Dehalococcoidia bacterium]